MISDDLELTCNVGPSQASSDRLLVLEVSTNNESKILKTVSLSSGEEIIVALYDDWIESAIETGHVVRVVLTDDLGKYHPWDFAMRSHEPSVVVTTKCNLLIQHPDSLIPCTSVANSFTCLRRSVLSHRSPAGSITDTVAGTEAALFGHLIHEMFQIILARDSNAKSSVETGNSDWGSQGLDTESFFEAAEEALYRHHEEMYVANVSMTDARLVLHKVTSDIMQWYKGFMTVGKGSNSEGVSVPDGKMTRRIVVSEVLDIEELIWSPVFGLKGKIDATVRLKIDGANVGIGILELKTGKSTGYAALYHSAQVSLYSMLLSDRKDRLVNHGLLTYIPYQDALQAVRDDQSQSSYVGEKIGLLQSQPTVGAIERQKYVASSRDEIIGLVMQRNRLASYLRVDASIEELPPLLAGKEEVCKRCFSNESCLVQHKLIEKGTPESVSDGPGSDLFRKKTSHLKPDHEEYYRFWRLALADEENYAGGNVKEIWSMDAEEREDRGSCVSSLKLNINRSNEKGSPYNLLSPGEQVEAHFTIHHELLAKRPKRNRVPPHVNMSSGDYIIISAERNLKAEKHHSGYRRATSTWQSALSNGFIRKVTQDSITVAVDRNLEAWLEHQGLNTEEVYWRIDRQEVYSSYKVSRKTLESLFGTEEVCGTEKLRQLVIDLKPPEFEDEKVGSYQDGGLNSQGLAGMDLNQDQEKAVQMSLQAKDYVLILGMPGTGKTTTLVAIVMATASQGRSILLCSHTNSAVDNLLRKLLDLGFEDFVRIGRNLDVIDSKIHPYHFSRKFTQGKPISHLERELQEPRVVATTCLGISHPLLVRRKKFDLVVVDEASQILQPICLGPLLFANGAFILVGDHYQLPPLQRTSKERKTVASGPKAQIGHFKIMTSGSEKSQTESLFRRLCVAHPDAMVTLTTQYRMAEDIMNLANELIYSGSLTCSNSEVSMQALPFPDRGVSQLQSTWMTAVLNPLERVVFLDVEPRNVGTMSPKTKEVIVGDGKGTFSDNICDRDNEAEANIVVKVVEKILEVGLSCSEITVLSPFRAQVRLIRETLAHSESPVQTSAQDVEVSTIDQYQGKDNSCVVVSFVRNHEQTLGPLLKDWRRVNVALTRAKKKLILVGSETTLRNGSKVFERMIAHLHQRSRIYAAY